MSEDGKTLYASSSDKLYSWAYNPDTGSVDSGSKKTLVKNMSNTDHSTRTLLLSKKAKNLMLISRGSAENIDDIARDITSGHSQLRAFDISGSIPDGGFNYATEGKLIAWGLRNSVGVAEEPTTGGIFTVENSADQIQRNGVDIHQDDPGEEMNFHGDLGSNDQLHGTNYGYPDCFALWGENIPDQGSLKVGDQFVFNPSSTLNDTTCAKSYTAPRLTFQVSVEITYQRASMYGSANIRTPRRTWPLSTSSSLQTAVRPTSPSTEAVSPPPSPSSKVPPYHPHPHSPSNT